MSTEKQQAQTISNSVIEQLATETALTDPATIEGLKELTDKLTPLIQAGRLNNIVDLLSLVSDNIEFLDETMVEKASKSGEEILALGWTAGNAIRMANAQTEQLENPPSVFQIMRAMNDPDVRRAMHFYIGFMRIIGKQMRPE